MHFVRCDAPHAVYSRAPDGHLQLKIPIDDTANVEGAAWDAGQPNMFGSLHNGPFSAPH